MNFDNQGLATEEKLYKLPESIISIINIIGIFIAHIMASKSKPFNNNNLKLLLIRFEIIIEPPCS